MRLVRGVVESLVLAKPGRVSLLRDVFRQLELDLLDGPLVGESDELEDPLVLNIGDQIAIDSELVAHQVIAVQHREIAQLVLPRKFKLPDCFACVVLEGCRNGQQ